LGWKGCSNLDCSKIKAKLSKLTQTVPSKWIIVLITLICSNISKKRNKYLKAITLVVFSINKLQTKQSQAFGQEYPKSKQASFGKKQ